jgi:hypothetical protein
MNASDVQAITSACVHLSRLQLQGRICACVCVCICLFVHVGTCAAIYVSDIAHFSASQASCRLSDESEPAHFSLSA